MGMIVATSNAYLHFVGNLKVTIHGCENVHHLRTDRRAIYAIRYAVARPPYDLRKALVKFPNVALPFHVPAKDLAIRHEVINDGCLELRSPYFIVAKAILIHVGNVVGSIRSKGSVLLHFGRRVHQGGVMVVRFRVVIAEHCNTWNRRASRRFVWIFRGRVFCPLMLRLCARARDGQRQRQVASSIGSQVRCVKIAGFQVTRLVMQESNACVISANGCTYVFRFRQFRRVLQRYVSCLGV